MTYGWKVTYSDMEWVLVLAADAQEARRRADREFTRFVGQTPEVYLDGEGWDLADVRVDRQPILDRHPLGFSEADLVRLRLMAEESLSRSPGTERMTVVMLTTEW